MSKATVSAEDSVCLTCRREKDKSPFTFQETVEFQRGIILEGIDRGVSLIQILERLVMETPICSEDAPASAIVAELRRIDQAQIEFYKSPSHKYGTCSRCSAYTDKKNMVCANCAGEKHD